MALSSLHQLQSRSVNPLEMFIPPFYGIELSCGVDWQTVKVALAVVQKTERPGPVALVDTHQLWGAAAKWIAVASQRVAKCPKSCATCSALS